MDPIQNGSVYVIDSWPVLEKARRRTPLAAFDALVDRADRGEVQLLMSEMNLGEAAVRAVLAMPIEIRALQPGEAMEAARLKARYAVSYADCFCANLAIRTTARVLTGDPEFLLLSRAGVVQVEWLGA